MAVALVAAALGAVTPVGSAVAAGTTIVPPGAPTIRVLGDVQVFEVGWCVDDNGGEDPTEVELDWRELGAPSWQRTGATGELIVCNGMEILATSGQTYEVRVRARNSAGWGPYSDTDTATPQPDNPSGPENVTAQAGVESITVSWSPSPPGGANPITSYRVQWRVPGGSWTATFTAADAVQQTINVPGGVTVEARVRALTAVGESPTIDVYPDVVAQKLLVSSSLSAIAFRPYKDGFQDTVTAKVTTNADVPVTMQVTNGSGQVVRSVSASSSSVLEFVWDGRSDSGARVPPATYRVRLLADWDGPTKVLLAKTVRVVLSQVKTPRVKRPYATVYPVKDGYRDSVTFTIAANLPAHGKIIVTKDGRVAFKTALRKGRHWEARWNGRFNGRVVKGTYWVSVTLTGGEGVARTRILREKVSPQHL